jgi:hypothetical protein
MDLKGGLIFLTDNPDYLSWSIFVHNRDDFSGLDIQITSGVSGILHYFTLSFFTYNTVIWRLV